MQIKEYQVEQSCISMDYSNITHMYTVTATKDHKYIFHIQVNDIDTAEYWYERYINAMQEMI